MNMRVLLHRRMRKLKMTQKELARAAGVSPSYVSQLLRGRKLPPSPVRTDFYRRVEEVTGFEKGRLARLADHEIRETKRRRLAQPTMPLMPLVRDALLDKCSPEAAEQVRPAFARRSFGVVESLVTRKALEVVQGVIREEGDSSEWLAAAASIAGTGKRALRAMLGRVLGADASTVADADFATAINLLITSWKVDLVTLSVEIVTDPRLAIQRRKSFGYVERAIEAHPETESGLKKFLDDPLLSGDCTEGEARFLRGIRFKDRRPTALFYYRTLQNLRDPLNFNPPEDEDG